LALQKERDGKGFVVRLRDKPMTAYRMDAIMIAFQQVSEDHWRFGRKTVPPRIHSIKSIILTEFSLH